MSDRETTDIGVGPFSLDCEMARRMGWTEEEIERAGEMLSAFSMGVQSWQARRAGLLCEHCGAHATKYSPCETCGDTGRPSYMADERLRRGL